MIGAEVIGVGMHRDAVQDRSAAVGAGGDHGGISQVELKLVPDGEATLVPLPVVGHSWPWRIVWPGIGSAIKAGEKTRAVGSACLMAQ